MQALFLEAGGARMQLVPSLAQALLQSPANELRTQWWLPPPQAATTIPGEDGGDGGDGGGEGGEGGEGGTLGRFRNPAIPAPPMRKRLGVPAATAGEERAT